MLIRLILLLSALSLVVAGLAFLFTRDTRYLLFIRRAMRFLVFLLLVFAVLFALERFGLAAWGILV